MRTRIRISDLSFLFTATIIAVSCITHSESVPAHFQLWNLSHCVVAYFATRALATVLEQRYFDEALAIATAVLCIWQIASGNTGTFGNTGIFGGCLAVSASLMVTWLVSYRSNRKSRRNKFVRIVVTLSAIAALTAIPFTMSRAAILSIVASMTAFVLSTAPIRRFIRIKFKPYRGRQIAIICTVTLLAVICSVSAYNIKKASADSRILMAGISIEAICENPLHGAGPGRFLYAYGESLRRHFHSGNFTEKERLTADCPEYPFNTFLQIGTEYGFPAMLLSIAGVISAIIWQIKRGSPSGYGLLALSVFSLFSYPQEFMSFRILAAVLAASIFDENGCQKKAHNTVRILFILALTTTIMTEAKEVRPRLKAETEWQKHITAYQPQAYGIIAAKGAQFMEHMSHDYHFLFQYGQALFETGEYEKADSILQLGTEISCDPMFWNLLGRCREAKGNYKSAEQCYMRAFETVPNRIYPLWLLANLYHKEGNTSGLFRICEYAQKFVPKKESETTRRLRQEISDLIDNSEICQDTVLTGIMNVNVVPTPSVESTVSFPWCTSVTIE